MNCWRSLVLPVLALVLLSGCVYGPPYYEDPISPAPWPLPLEPYHPRERYLHIPPEPYAYRRRHLDPGRDTRYYQPEPSPSDQQTAEAEPEPTVPPSKTDLPAPEKKPEPKPDTKSVPTASKGSKPGRVKVPFPPYNELDVSGMPSGSLAKDPTSGKLFRIP